MKDQEKLLPGLYMVSTPIGNLEDLTFRSLNLLENASWIAAEDTRQARKLLESQGISGKELISLHGHSGAGRVAHLIERLKAGTVGAYVSDAGTPGICDPGAELVAAAAQMGIAVFPIPGANALTALLSVSGIDASRFCFHGFFPRENADRQKWATATENAGGLHVFFESPHRILSCLKFLLARFAGSALVVGRELTKKFETITRGSVEEVEAILSGQEPRGEYVCAILLGAASEQPAGLRAPEVEALLAELVGLGAGQKTLIRVAMSHGMAKNAAYDLSLQVLKK